MKDMGSPYVHLTPEARQVMQNMVDEYFARFKNVVVTSRGIKDPDTLKLVTDGRVFSGERAVQLGLADSDRPVERCHRAGPRNGPCAGRGSGHVQAAVRLQRFHLCRDARAAAPKQ